MRVTRAVLRPAVGRGRTFALQQDVRRLQITMDDLLAVGRVDGVGERLGQSRRLPRRLWPSSQVRVQCPAGDVLEYEIGRAARLADLVQLHHVRVLEPSNRLGFRAQSVAVCLGGKETRVEHLDCHRPVQGEVSGVINDARAAATQLAQELIAGDLRQRALRVRLGDARRLAQVP